MLASSAPDEPLAQLLARLDADGYLIFPALLSRGRLADIRDALAPWLGGMHLGRNDFEGYRSERVYALLAKSPVFAELATEPLVLALCEAVLGPHFLLSACLAIKLHPGETAQALHYDDSFVALPRPRPSYALSTFWAIDAYTADNGATEIIPGSHRWGEERPHTNSAGPGQSPVSAPGAFALPETHPDLQPALMPAGSLMVCLGTLWHRGGGNRSTAARLAITPQYCAGWARQMENMTLAVPPAVAASLPPRAQELLGYSIWPPFMGHVDGLHPKRLLPQNEPVVLHPKETSS